MEIAYLKLAFVAGSRYLRARAKSTPSEATARNPPVITANAQNDSLFFRLPPELRNLIYMYAFCRQTPANMIKSRPPVGDVVELIKFKDAISIRATNDVLGTCRMINNEVWNIFVATRRSFWVRNNLLEALKDDWEDVTIMEAKPPFGVTVLRHDCYNLVPRIVVSVVIGPCIYDYHLVTFELSVLALDKVLVQELRSQNHAVNRMIVQRKFSAASAVIIGVYMELFTEPLFSKVVQVTEYAHLAHQHVNIATAQHKKSSQRERRMVQDINRAVLRVIGERRDRTTKLRQATLRAVLKHLCNSHNVQLRPHGSA